MPTGFICRIPRALRFSTVSKISVIIPNYNRAGLIAETLSNLLSQTHPPSEIIVVDDGSTDDSIGVIKSFGRRVTLIEQQNRGPGAARNAGLAIARGDYIQFQDSDDLLSLNKLELQAQALEEVQADIALGPWAHVTMNDGVLSFEDCVLQQGLPSQGIDLTDWLLKGWSTIFQSLMLRRTFLIAAGNYRTDIKYGEDMEFLFRISLMNPKITIAPNTLTLYRVDAPSKLSLDSGSSNYQRIHDWSICLRCMIENYRRGDRQLNFITKAVFLASVRKHLRYFQPGDEEAQELAEFLLRATRELPSSALVAAEFSMRVFEKLRSLRTGNRWKPEFQAAPPTPEQLSLIADLGFATC